jgi:ribosomal subunit interface protein
MELILTQKNLSETEAKQFNEYVEKKVAQIESLLEVYPEGSVIMKVLIEKFEKHDAFSVEMSLALPGEEKLMASEASHNITKALDLSKDRLVAQIKKIRQQKRANRTHKSIRQDIHQVSVEHVEQ